MDLTNILTRTDNEKKPSSQIIVFNTFIVGFNAPSSISEYLRSRIDHVESCDGHVSPGPGLNPELSIDYAGAHSNVYPQQL
jgi:hypothetical protein